MSKGNQAAAVTAAGIIAVHPLTSVFSNLGTLTVHRLSNQLPPLEGSDSTLKLMIQARSNVVRVRVVSDKADVEVRCMIRRSQEEMYGLR